MASLKISTDLRNLIRELIFPVGSVYIGTSTANPSTRLGGTWVRVSGKYLYAAEGIYTESTGKGTSTVSTTPDNVGATTLTVAQMPSHQHAFGAITYGDILKGSGSNEGKIMAGALSNSWMWGVGTPVQGTGGGKSHTHTSAAHTHAMNYAAFVVWRRTA